MQDYNFERWGLGYNYIDGMDYWTPENPTNEMTSPGYVPYSCIPGDCMTVYNKLVVFLPGTDYIVIVMYSYRFADKPFVGQSATRT